MIKKTHLLSVLVASLGYFVDIYDLLLFGIVRIPSLKDMGVKGADLLPIGVHLLNMQLAGMLLGGVIWGVLGDRRGRRSVLFGSILLYSVCNIANAFVADTTTYSWLRFLTGIGLAGELGAAVTLVAETVPQRIRGYSTSILASVGVLGAVAASWVGHRYSWQTAYLVGGFMGLGLIILRAKLPESALFLSMKSKRDVRQGCFHLLFTRWHLFKKYILCILVGAPVWYVMGVIVTFSPEVAKALGVTTEVSSGTAIFWAYLGASLGDLTSGIVAQILRSRNRVIALYVMITSLFVIALFCLPSMSERLLYIFCFIFGVTTGYWSTVIIVAAEQFGTNLRSTVATTIPNFIRGTGVLMTVSLSVLGQWFSFLVSLQIVGLMVFVLAVIALMNLQEGFSRDLNYYEE